MSSTKHDPKNEPQAQDVTLPDYTTPHSINEPPGSVVGRQPNAGPHDAPLPDGPAPEHPKKHK